jgi:hypothetical protein
MASLLRRMRRLFCRHEGKRVWDVNRLPDGTYRVRIYCPSCGWHKDELRAPDEIVREAAGENAEMQETMRRNLNLDPDDADTHP